MSSSGTTSSNPSGASLASGVPTTASSTTASSTTASSTTASSTTASSITASPTTASSTTASPTTDATTLSTSSTPTSSAFPTFTGPANSTATGHHGSSVSGGAIAGIVIGTLIAAAILSSIGLWFYIRRKRASKTPWSSENGYSKRNPTTDHGVAISKDPETQMQSYVIAERADDSQLRHQMQNLGELIYQHVENHYTTGSRTGTSQDLAATLRKCGYSERTEPTISTLGSLLGNSSEGQTAIKSLIAWVILRGVELNSGSEYSLLPDEITSFYRSALKDNKQLNKQDAAHENVLSRVRELSTRHISSSKSPEDASKDASIARVVNLLNSILQPFIKPSSKSSQFDNLASIIYQGREFGLLLLAQPGNWLFGWQTSTGVESNTKDQIVVFPSLEEVINKDGKERRRVVCEQERETI
ncbi:uncharacterized protein EAE97_005404 [Botrytis byssoidea]|uniref:Uncharacterized protein n=1 Tax=Botrytis byssoidea TaxID=139641 RepID=A0A9P5IRW6_9HELO|nr:uncharacterized protein EAE97_005404 [Botrytis byssoidea]KAF7944771.1 hypothetical protein EAE97_005404 [Botrytis byssoidea]